MSATYDIRRMLVDLARQDVGKKEVTKNQAPWIAKFWPATTYPNGMANREPYCVAALAYWVMRWLSNEQVLFAFNFSPQDAEKWRCKSPSVFRADDSWYNWAKKAQGVEILPKYCILHMADIAIYEYSHGELVSDDDGTEDGPFTGLGFNTNQQGSADGDGCWEKPRSRSRIKCFIRMIE